MTDRERAIDQLKNRIKATHNNLYDFVIIPVDKAKTIVRLLEEDAGVVRCRDCENYESGICKRTWKWFEADDDWYCGYGRKKHG